LRFQRPRGTKDYLPEECIERRKVIETARRVFELYGYGEVVTPAFEHLELLERKAGEEVREQIYWFKDKAGRLLGLRFDMTTSIARIVANNPVMPKPIRFYYIGPVWRYEEPQRGRLREFWQAGVELIGSPFIDADAEVIALTFRFFRELGLDHIKVKINDRSIMNALARHLRLDSNAKIERFLRAIDKYYKRGREVVEKELRELGITDVQKILEFISSSTQEDLDPTGLLSRIGVEDRVKVLENLLDILVNAYGISREKVEIDYSIVRGIGYYTGLVFEFMDDEFLNLGSLAAGGRYDELIKLLGGVDTPATGMSIGIERVVELIRLRGGNSMTSPPNALVLIASPVEDFRYKVIELAEMMRNEGIPSIVDVMRRRLRVLIERADKLSIPVMVILGPKELEKGEVVLRDLKNRRQWCVPMKNVVKEVKRILTQLGFY